MHLAALGTNEAVIHNRTVEVVPGNCTGCIDRRTDGALAAPGTGTLGIEARNGAVARTHEPMMHEIAILVLAGFRALLVYAVRKCGRAGNIERRHRAVAGADKSVNPAGRVPIKPGNLARRIDALGVGVCRVRWIETRVDGFG